MSDFVLVDLDAKDTRARSESRGLCARLANVETRAHDEDEVRCLNRKARGAKARMAVKTQGESAVRRHSPEARKAAGYRHRVHVEKRAQRRDRVA